MNTSITNFNMNETVATMDFEKVTKEIQRFGEKSQFLPLPYKKIWFKSTYPAGHIRYFVTESTESFVQIEARVYEKNTDPDCQFIGSGKANAFRNTLPETVGLTGKEAIAVMELAARGSAATRALSDAGFGLQFFGDIEPDDIEEQAHEAKKQVLNPVVPENKEKVTDSSSNVAAETEKKSTRGRKKKVDTDDAATELPVQKDSELEETTETPLTETAESEPTTSTQPIEKISEENITVEQTDLSNSDEKLPFTVDEESCGDEHFDKVVEQQLMNEDKLPFNEEDSQETLSFDTESTASTTPEQDKLSKARSYIAGIGKLADQTLGWIEENKPLNLRWIYSQPKTDNDVRNAVLVIAKNNVEIKETFEALNIPIL